MTQNEVHLRRLIQFADDPKRATRIARLARSVGKTMGDSFFDYVAYAVETHADVVRCIDRGDADGAQRCSRERESLIRTALAS